jgi:energy-coupling factor transporter ATP-binding protein EcfA2
MVDLRNKPLLDTTADAELFVEPAGLGRIDAALRSGLNVAILGERGVGKTTLARQLTRLLREQGKPVVFVSAEPASDAADAVASIREQLATADGIPEALQQAVSSPAESERLADLARSLAVSASQPTVVVVDGIDADSGHELFGRLRDVLWQAPVTWVVTGPDRGLLAPPADSFFEQVTELSPLTVGQVDELLKRRLGADARKLPVHDIAEASEGNPRRALELARDVVIDRQDLASVLEQRALRESRVSELGRAPSMLLAEIEQLARPVWASDEELLARMGWTRNRAVQVLGQLEHEGFLRSYSDRGPRGGSVKMYSIPSRGSVSGSASGPRSRSVSGSASGPRSKSVSGAGQQRGRGTTPEAGPEWE